jgi:hypothetical protein
VFVPQEPIISHLTSLTGIKALDLEGADDLPTVLERLKEKIPTNSIIVGQGIASDIKWLGLREGEDFKEPFDVAVLFRTPIASSHRDPTAGAWTPPPSPGGGAAQAAVAKPAGGAQQMNGAAGGDADGSGSIGSSNDMEKTEGGDGQTTEEASKDGVKENVTKGAVDEEKVWNQGEEDAVKDGDGGETSGGAVESNGIESNGSNAQSPTNADGTAEGGAVVPMSPTSPQGAQGQGGGGSEEMLYRYYSLRHVVRWLLGTDMQEGVHDPILDARFAMEIFVKYRHVHEDNTIDFVLQTLKQAPRTPPFAEATPMIDGVAMAPPGIGRILSL